MVADLLTQIYDVSRAAVADMDLDRFLGVITLAMRDSLVADDVVVLMREEEAAWGVAWPPAEDVARRETHAALATAAQRELNASREPFVLSKTALAAHPHVASALYCPLYGQGAWQMAMVALRLTPRDPFSSFDVRHATVFTGFAAPAVKYARLFEHMIRRWKDLDAAHP